VYASSTSALATGSALTFDGTNFSTTGIANIGNGARIQGSGSLTGTGVGAEIFASGGVSYYTSYDRTGSAYAPIQYYSGTYQAWNIGGERMRLTTTGLGIGTSSPSVSLDVQSTNAAARFNSSDANGVYAAFSVNGTAKGYIGSAYQIVASSSANDFAVQAANNFVIATNGSTRTATFDTSGNLGLGVTPSAWNSGAMLGFQISTAASFAGDVGTPRARMMANAYYSSGGFKYITSNYATLYTQDGVTGQHQWLNAPSGTAGNAISFTQAMTLDNSGNLGIGTTSPTRKLDVSNAGSSYIRASDTTDSVYVDMLAASSGGWIGTQSNHAFLFQTNNTERMRLTSGGFLLVGTTSQPFGTGNFVSQSNSQTTAVPGVFSDTRSDASGSGMLYFVRNGSLVGQVSTTSTATSYVTSSDRRLKNNIVDAPDGNIDQIKIRSFDWLTDNTHNTYGVIAQELLEVAPYAVHVPTNPDEMMGVDYSKLVPMMIKEIQSLKAEVATLKGA